MSSFVKTLRGTFFGVKLEEVDLKENSSADEEEFVFLEDGENDELEPVCQIPPLRIIILIVGSRGDVQPFLAYAKGLQKAGHHVRIATHIKFKSFVEDEGVEFFPLQGDPEALMQFMVSHPDMITLNAIEVQEKKVMMKSIYWSAWQACTSPGNYRPDVIISNPPVHVHLHLAEKLQIPLHIMFTMPWSPTRDYVHPLAPGGDTFGAYNSYKLADEMVWVGMGPTINEFRKKCLNLPPLLRGASLLNRMKIPHLYCMSPHLAPKPSDWGPHIDVVGFWFLQQESNYKPPEDLMKFIHAGPKPIYIGFGSIVVSNPAQLNKNVIEAIKASGQRAIVGSGWAKLGHGIDLPDTIFVIEAAPHDWLFQHCSAVCHHGGAGTTAAGLRAGLPTIVVPFFGDQPFWGARVAQMGVGPEPIPYKHLTAENLKDAILFCTKPEIVKAAHELGEKLQNEDGVAAGVEAFHRKLPCKQGVWTCEIYETQRFFVGAGWTHAMLATDHYKYSDKTGHMLWSKEAFTLPPGWEWMGDWEVDINENTDKDGWRYRGGVLGDKAWHAKGEWNDALRVRKFTRRRRLVSEENWLHEVSRNFFDFRGKGESFLLFVDILAAKNLPSGDRSGLSDPYITLKVLDLSNKLSQKQKTKIKKQTVDPEWKETMCVTVTDNDILKFYCWDKDMVGKQLLCQMEIPVNKINITREKPIVNEWFDLQRKSQPSGSLHLKFYK